tara:strand:+ start:97 stop:276 length:180 start_codon:yes stop_codon:yes gene_type:complete
MSDKIKCIFCNRTVRKYKKWKDWKGRNSCYKCYKEDREWGHLKKYRFWKDKPQNKIAKT